MAKFLTKFALPDERKMAFLAAKSFGAYLSEMTLSTPLSRQPIHQMKRTASTSQESFSKRHRNLLHQTTTTTADIFDCYLANHVFTVSLVVRTISNDSSSHFSGRMPRVAASVSPTIFASDSAGFPTPPHTNLLTHVLHLIKVQDTAS